MRTARLFSQTLLLTLLSLLVCLPTAHGTAVQAKVGASKSAKKILICHRDPKDPGKGHPIWVSENAVAAHLRHGDSLGACGGVGSLLEVFADRVSGVVGGSFQLSVSNIPGTASRIEWDLGDGRTATGAVVNVSYNSGGTYALTVSALGAGGDTVAQGAFLVTVFDPATGSGLFSNNLPRLPGDIDNDGILTLRDAAQLRQHLSGLRVILDEGMADRADFSLDGTINELDATLLVEALLRNATVPNRLEPSAGEPGRTITIYSPALLDPSARVEVKIGGAPAFMPPRIILGRVTTTVPLDVLTPGQFTELPGLAPIELIVDGVVVETFRFQVLAPTPVDAANPLAPVRALLKDLAALRSDLVARLRGLGNAGAAIGLQTNDPAILALSVEIPFAELNRLEAEFLTMVEGLPDSAKQALVRYGNANGVFASLPAIAELVAQSQPVSLSRVVSGGDLDQFCAIGALAETIKSASDGASYLCAGLMVLATAAVFAPEPILDVPTIFAAAVACAKYSAFLELPSVILSTLPKLGSKLDVQVEPAGTLAPGETASIRVFIPIANVTETCSSAAGVAGGKLKELIAKKLTLRVLQKGPVFVLYTAVKNVSEATTKALVDQVSSTVGTVLGAVGLDAALEGITKAICSNFSSLDPRFQLDSSEVQATATPNVGTITHASGANPILFTCPMEPGVVPEEGVKLKFTYFSCAKPLEAETTILCGELRDVTITMGDNGTANDDIYEVVVNGDSVLTSGVPVRQVSTTIKLAVGDHSLQMRGLAAPDGIGTYYITVTGGTLTGGPPLSGDDLIAGAVFSWTLRVEAQP